MTEARYGGDPLSAPFWAAAAAGELVIQRCGACGHHQLYPRPFCRRCFDDDLGWVQASGQGVVYSRTCVRMGASDPRTAPWVGIVRLAEGPSVLAFVAEGHQIGDQVSLAWRPGDPPTLAAVEPP